MIIKSLAQIVSESLDFFSDHPLPSLKLSTTKFFLVIGSGNAFNAGQVIFGHHKAIFANESNLKEILTNYQSLIKNKTITEAIIISASGEKDAVWETQLVKKNNLQSTLLTCNPDSTAAKLADKVISYRRIAEPYTYNTSTYLGMILSASKEKPDVIKKTIKKLKTKPFGKYSSFAFILPDEYSAIGEMINIKGDELFGPHLNIRAFTQGQARHAKFVHPWNKELVISLGSKNKYFGAKESRWDIMISFKDRPALLMALSYHLMGRIQEAKPQYFKKNIKNYCQTYGPQAYAKKQKFDVIIPGN